MPREPDLSCEHTDPDHYRLILENIRDFAIFSADLHGRIDKWNPGHHYWFEVSQRAGP